MSDNIIYRTWLSIPLFQLLIEALWYLHWVEYSSPRRYVFFFFFLWLHRSIKTEIFQMFCASFCTCFLKRSAWHIWYLWKLQFELKWVPWFWAMFGSTAWLCYGLSVDNRLIKERRKKCGYLQNLMFPLWYSCFCLCCENTTY